MRDRARREARLVLVEGLQHLNALTLIAQDELQPPRKVGSDIKSKDMHLHTLPWPRDVLRSLFATEVTLRVTLSYFVEPNPARRGWTRKHRYASHGLRFAMRNPDESLAQFTARVSAEAQNEDEGLTGDGEERGWLVGSRRRDRGSIHSDFWRGTAADLAERYHVAVFPVGGWWKERKPLGRYERSVRYALLVSIETPPEAADVYIDDLDGLDGPTEDDALAGGPGGGVSV